MQYYTPLTCVSIHNPADIALNLHMRIRCQPIGKDVQVIVFFAEDNSKRSNCFTRQFRVSGIFFENSPYQKATLWLESENLYAIVELDLADLGIAECRVAPGKSITLSPIPFGKNGKPKLPYKGEDLAMFLRVIRVLSLYPSQFIFGEQLRQDMIPILLSADRHYDFWEATAAHWLSETDKLGITCDLGDRGRKILMLPQELENVFDIKLPNA